jgi:ribosomal protein L40E
MQNLLPTLFIVLGACALILTLFWLWMSLRHTFAHVEDAQVAAVDPTSSPRAALLAEKQSLLVALKDLEAERDNGKLSEADFSELNARYRARARSVLKQLDAQIAPHRDAAKALLNAASDSPKAEVLATSHQAAAVATQVCPSCSASNDSDATFCKKCGARLQAEAKS